MRLNPKRALLLGLLCALTATSATADSNARIVRLSYLDGDVQVERRTGSGFEAAIVNMPITQGMIIKTNDGRAEVQFEEGSTVRLVPESLISFEQLSLRSSGAKSSAVEVQEGTAYFEIRHIGGDDFTVQFAHRTLELPRPSRFRVSVANSEVKLAVFKGELELRPADKSLKIKKDETLTLDLSDPGRYLLARGTEPEAFDAWDKERAEYEQQYSSASSYNSYPYYGRGDLNYYGNFWYQPGYGYLWRPYNTGLGWDPFLDGAWMWYPGFGYTWISGYPWGWLPYRFGNWVYVPGWGWGWRSGDQWRNWALAPTVVNPPAGYTRPQPPAPTPSPATTASPVPPKTVIVGEPRRPQARYRGTFTNENGDAVHSSMPANNGVVSGAQSAPSPTAPAISASPTHISPRPLTPPPAATKSVTSPAPPSTTATPPVSAPGPRTVIPHQGSPRSMQSPPPAGREGVSPADRPSAGMNKGANASAGSNRPAR